MRIFNGKNASLDLPLIGGTKLPAIAPHSLSMNFMPNEAFLNLIATAYDEHEIALVLSGPFEMTMCSNVAATLPLVCESLEEAIERFTPKDDKDKVAESQKKEEPEKEEEKVETPEPNEAVEPKTPAVDLGSDKETGKDANTTENPEPVKKPMKRHVVSKAGKK